MLGVLRAIWFSWSFCFSAAAWKSKAETAELLNIPGFVEVVAFELKSMPAAELDPERGVELGTSKDVAGFWNGFGEKIGVGFPKIEVLSKDSRPDEVLYVDGAKEPDTLAVVLNLGGSPFPFILFCGLADLDLDRLPSSSDEPSTKRDSVLANELSSTSVTSSERPCACA